LLLAAGEGIGAVVGAGVEVDEREEFGDTVGVGLRGAAVDEERQRDVLAGGKGGQEVVVLEDDAHAAAAEDGALAVGHGGEAVALDAEFAGGELGEAANEVEEGALAGAAGAHDGGEGAGGHLEVDAVKGDDALVRGVVDLADRPGVKHHGRRRGRMLP